jgi:ADP-ribosylation factor GTPase-activating protein 2/3
VLGDRTDGGILLILVTEWQWDQLRIMKVGGNESATKFFQSNGGTAALNSKDPKVKYTSNAATKYKEELKRRAARDAQEYVLNSHISPHLTCNSYPTEVVITDVMGNVGTDGTSTPAGEPDDDFFSSWDKPSIKRPTPPISRTATPPVVGRTPSPFLNAGTGAPPGGIARTSSPLVNSESAAAAPRTTSSAALRKTTTAGAGPRKANVLGAKKTQKLGAKKLTGDVIDFDAAEKKAKEEAERIEKLGYDPDAEEATTKKALKTADTTIVSPKPVNPTRGGFGNPSPKERSEGDVARLGMGMGRLGFGQVGGAKPAAAAQKKMGGFGSVGPIKAQPEGMLHRLKYIFVHANKYRRF